MITQIKNIYKKAFLFKKAYNNQNNFIIPVIWIQILGVFVITILIIFA